ncbi:esterase [bacterium]|nr:esterase [bacterium]
MRPFLLLVLSWLTAVSLPAQGKLRELLTAKAPEGFVEQSWTIDGVKRTALVRVPKDAKGPLPVVFCWHGHGGRAAQAAGRWGYDQADTTSLLVFPQGLPTVSPLVDKEGRMPGWQTALGGEGDRDVKLFDAMLADLRKSQAVDDRRIYSMGHSNGAAFSYLLWQARPTVLAAIGSVAGSLRGDVKELSPLPVIHVAGENDPLVKFAWQQATFAAVRRFNHCVDTAKPWAKEGVLEASLFESDRGAPLVTALHAGGHEYAKGSSELIARFFKAQVRPAR